MTFKEPLLGTIVLGVVLGGVYLARRSSPAPAPPTHAAQPQPGQRGAPSHPASTTSADETAVPDVTTADASIDLDGARVTLALATRPPVAFTTKHFRVRVEALGQPLELENGVISFEMKMPMGDHRYTLVADADGWHKAAVVLPFCPSGNPRWYAIVEGRAGGRPFSARFRLDLTKP